MAPGRKLASLIWDLVMVNARYVSDRGRRNRIREVLKQDGMTASEREWVDRETQAALPAARVFAGLTSASMSLAGLRLDESQGSCLNLVITGAYSTGNFAGIRTALVAAGELSTRLSLQLRVVLLDFGAENESRRATEHYVRTTSGVQDATIVTRRAISTTTFGTGDVWLATHWSTAHAIQVASAVGLIDPRRVAYLIQDFEPGFSPWSTTSVVARSTYDAGFLPIVNSLPLWRFLCDHEGLDVARSQVFSPVFDEAALREAASRRTQTSRLRVLFYGRPSKDRNLYQLGIAALRSAVLQLGIEADAVDFISAGERHNDVALDAGHTVVNLGSLSWDEYFAVLSSATVVLSLQASPHPSHPPFDAAISGATAITNDFLATRNHLHPRLVAVEAEPRHLGQAIAQAVRERRQSMVADYQPIEAGVLGNPLGDVLDVIASTLPRASQR